jgi:hypothetical protein
MWWQIYQGQENDIKYLQILINNLIAAEKYLRESEE